MSFQAFSGGGGGGRGAKNRDFKVLVCPHVLSLISINSYKKGMESL